jgi:hypothetical protein
MNTEGEEARLRATRAALFGAPTVGLTAEGQGFSGTFYSS